MTLVEKNNHKNNIWYSAEKNQYFLLNTCTYLGSSALKVMFPELSKKETFAAFKETMHKLVRNRPAIGGRFGDAISMLDEGNDAAIKLIQESDSNLFDGA